MSCAGRAIDDEMRAARESRADVYEGEKDRQTQGGGAGCGYSQGRMKERRVWPGDWLSLAAAPLSTCLSTVGVMTFARRNRATCWSSSVTISSPSGTGVGGPGVLPPLSDVRARLASLSESFHVTFGRLFLPTSFTLFDSSGASYATVSQVRYSTRKEDYIPDLEKPSRPGSSQ